MVSRFGDHLCYPHPMSKERTCEHCGQPVKQATLPAADGREICTRKRSGCAGLRRKIALEEGWA